MFLMAVILLYARAWQALAACRSLGERGIKVITADSIHFAPTYFSKYSKSHFFYEKVSDEKQFITSLLDGIDHTLVQ